MPKKIIESQDWAQHEGRQWSESVNLKIPVPAQV